MASGKSRLEIDFLERGFNFQSLIRLLGCSQAHGQKLMASGVIPPPDYLIGAKTGARWYGRTVKQIQETLAATTRQRRRDGADSARAASVN